MKEYIEAANYGYRPFGVKPFIIVVHSTANSTIRGAVYWFMNPKVKVSAHYIIGKNGRVIQMVPEHRRAWHAGHSRWKNVQDVNDYSIGIELINRNNGRDPYPKEQLQALGNLCLDLSLRYNIAPNNIVGHKDVSLTGKTDPRGLDLNELRDYIAEERAKRTRN